MHDERTHFWCPKCRASRRRESRVVVVTQGRRRYRCGECINRVPRRTVGDIAAAAIAVSERRGNDERLD